MYNLKGNRSLFSNKMNYEFNIEPTGFCMKHFLLTSGDMSVEIKHRHVKIKSSLQSEVIYGEMTDSDSLFKVTLMWIHGTSDSNKVTTTELFSVNVPKHFASEEFLEEAKKSFQSQYDYWKEKGYIERL